MLGLLLFHVFDFHRIVAEDLNLLYLRRENLLNIISLHK